MKKKNKLSVVEPVLLENRIFLIRGAKVMLDSDLALLYKVPVKRLNEQVKRNINRFPIDFMFRLTKDEKKKVVAICDHLRMLKYSYQLPYVFTEHGVSMLSSVLKSERAIQMNIFIIRVFTKLREMIVNNKELAHEVAELRHVQEKQGEKIEEINDAVVQLIGARAEPKDPIGFKND
jgi:hypothetical protein